MKLIVGLGNPGSRYAGTRHNAGRLVVEALGDSFGVKFTVKKRYHASIARIEGDVVLALPETFMNLSGKAVGPLVREFAPNPPSDLLIVTDDLALPLGKLRLRARGSDGGHNGLKSVTETLSSSDFARLRLGIGHPREGTDPALSGIVEEYVLTEFGGEERQEFDAVLGRALEACRLWLTAPISRAMTAVNS